MLFVKRLFLLVMVFTVPAALTWLSYQLAELVLLKTHRFIDPGTLRVAGIVEFAAFFFIAVLDARARWAARPSS